MVNGVAPRSVWSTLSALAAGSGGAPVPVTERHSSYVVPPSGQRSIQVTPCCQCGLPGVRCSTASHSPYGSRVNAGGSTIWRAPATGVHHPSLLAQLRPVRGSGRGRCAYPARSEEHTSELQSLMRISYAVFCLKKKKTVK